MLVDCCSPNYITIKISCGLTMADITMSLNDTLELDTIIEESSRASDLVTITDGTEGQDFNSNGIRTDTYIFDPINSGTYSIYIYIY